MKANLSAFLAAAMSYIVFSALPANARSLECPPELSYEDIIDIAKPAGKIIETVKFLPHDLAHFTKNMPTLRKGANLKKPGYVLGNHIQCIYQYSSAVGTYTLLIDGENIIVTEIENDKLLTPQQKKFLIAENFANDAIDPTMRRDASGKNLVHPKFNLQYFKIPLGKVREYKISKLLDPRIREALIFNDGKTDYLKWPIHPEDRKYYLEIMKLLKAHGLSDKDIQPVTQNSTDPERLDGYLTASRSIFFLSPRNRVAFTLKGSTNYISGKSEGFVLLKILTGDEAQSIIKANEYVDASMPKEGLKHLILQMEPLAYVIEGKGDLGSKGIIIRDLKDLGESAIKAPGTDGKFFYIPGFSITQDTNLPLLKDLVAKSLGNNINDVSKKDLSSYVINHYIVPSAKAMAELLAYFGINMTSLHGQQLLLQIDLNGMPTGKIVLRDFTDANLVKELVAKKYATLASECKSCFELPKIPDRFFIRNLLQFSAQPSWADKTEMDNWKLEYANTFNRRFSEITGVPTENEGTSVKLLGEKDRMLNPSEWGNYLNNFLSTR